MSVPYTAGNFSSGETDKKIIDTQIAFIDKNVPFIASISTPPTCCPNPVIPNYKGGVNSSIITLQQSAQTLLCNAVQEAIANPADNPNTRRYQQAVQQAIAKGQSPGVCQRKPFTNQGFVPVVRCTTAQEYLNVGVAKPVDTCFNVIGITQLRIN
jgi:hypothetical protein